MDDERHRPALSPSRATDFKQCPLRYRFRAVDRLPETPGPAALRGTVVHAVLERLFDLPAEERDPAAAKALLPRVWAELAAEAPELLAVIPVDEQVEPPETGPGTGEPDRVGAWLGSAEPLLDTYFTLEDPRTVEPGERELLVEAELPSGVPLRGFLDRLDVDASGALRIVDYKTGAAPREAGESRALFQMKFYALALLQMCGRVPEQLRLVYLGQGGEELTYRPDPAELRRFARVLEAIWAAILEADRTGDFRPNRGPGCSWCDHQPVCPAWDGTPPPYPGWPGLRGEVPLAPFGTGWVPPGHSGAA
jgi:putative RecB family exonuclease